MKWIMLVIAFFIIGALFIISENSLNLRDSHDLIKFKDSYVSWLNDIAKNLGNSVGYVVKMNWLPKE